MSDPPRLIGVASDFERSLLGAWDTRQPDRAVRARTLAAAGVVALSAGAGTALGSASSLAPKAALASSLILKWIGLGLGVVATVGLVGYASYSRLSSPTPQQATALQEPKAAPVARDVQRHDPAGDPWVEIAPAAPSPAVTRPAPATSTSSLEDEVYAIDQARRALTAGNPTTALQLVDAYDARYPTGALSQESAEIRIEALFRAGKRPLADKLANRFLAAHPASPYGREIRALMAGAASP